MLHALMSGACERYGRVMSEWRATISVAAGLTSGLVFCFTAFCFAAVVLHDFKQTSPPAVIAQCMVGLVSILVGVAVGLRVYRKKTPGVGSSCAHCGYNLTGNTSGTCPECGQRIRLPLQGE